MFIPPPLKLRIRKIYAGSTHNQNGNPKENIKKDIKKKLKKSQRQRDFMSFVRNCFFKMIDLNREEIKRRTGSSFHLSSMCFFKKQLFPVW